jgi:hypothetical protein
MMVYLYYRLGFDSCLCDGVLNTTGKEMFYMMVYLYYRLGFDSCLCDGLLNTTG